MVKHFLETNKPIASICHGAQLLAACSDLIKGKKITCYPACMFEVKLAGADHTECAVDDAIVDGNIVTAPAWPAHQKMLAKFVQLMGAKIEV